MAMYFKVQTWPHAGQHVSIVSAIISLPTATARLPPAVLSNLLRMHIGMKQEEKTTTVAGTRLPSKCDSQFVPPKRLERVNLVWTTGFVLDGESRQGDGGVSRSCIRAKHMACDLNGLKCMKRCISVD